MATESHDQGGLSSCHDSGSYWRHYVSQKLDYCGPSQRVGNMFSGNQDMAGRRQLSVTN